MDRGRGAIDAIASLRCFNAETLEVVRWQNNVQHNVGASTLPEMWLAAFGWLDVTIHEDSLGVGGIDRKSSVRILEFRTSVGNFRWNQPSPYVGPLRGEGVDHLSTIMNAQNK